MSDPEDLTPAQRAIGEFAPKLVIHLAFYAGWPRAMSAIQVAKAAFAD